MQKKRVADLLGLDVLAEAAAVVAERLSAGRLDTGEHPELGRAFGGGRGHGHLILPKLGQCP